MTGECQEGVGLVLPQALLCIMSETGRLEAESEFHIHKSTEDMEIVSTKSFFFVFHAKNQVETKLRFFCLDFSEIFPQCQSGWHGITQTKANQTTQTFSTLHFTATIFLSPNRLWWYFNETAKTTERNVLLRFPVFLTEAV